MCVYSHRFGCFWTRLLILWFVLYCYTVAANGLGEIWKVCVCVCLWSPCLTWQIPQCGSHQAQTWLCRGAGSERGGNRTTSSSNYSGCTVSHSPLASVKWQDTQADVMWMHGGEVQEKGGKRRERAKRVEEQRDYETKERVHLLEAAESKPRGWKWLRDIEYSIFLSFSWLWGHSGRG